MTEGAGLNRRLPLVYRKTIRNTINTPTTTAILAVSDRFVNQLPVGAGWR
ncbi:hypothetical protein [Lacticaseibacillus suihuaensis]